MGEGIGEGGENELENGNVSEEAGVRGTGDGETEKEEFGLRG